ncbi:MAG TPA: hypothetical protein VEV43_09350 [Actinomycetota bacterium]|nr:hypothetical protein [Actinomycetota bacterium]
MERAWPFEGVPEGGQNLRSPEDFLAAYGEGTEAVVVRIGLHDAQLVLVDARGGWQRWVYHSVEEATEVAERLGVPVHAGEYPEELRVKMNAFQRPSEDFDRRAYPEQGAVGPVIPYPENRPRRLEDPRREADRPGSKP